MAIEDDPGTIRLEAVMWLSAGDHILWMGSPVCNRHETAVARVSQVPTPMPSWFEDSNVQTTRYLTLDGV
ncbi:hypothetical protein TSTA_010180 [Talaromyces stipitatus ATCC 10500]|uniref:Uncharacterized protein n=1 Tax=Talaromyces stipitatus (strain ATCC 10500 / CBS 375.48 / QM 6759 / NRRL 1006) TaxID=441959 RepID=B8MG33_TALSN|nr:uncharacterized protein TSTA_010180 [Talaromyces stipitatus ATCC 10500]EED15900.1 hypothetical protein TSTA_010180 [Talaromyces stipitatus ATCC 10500]